MCHLLNARADKMAINITLNSFGTQYLTFCPNVRSYFPNTYPPPVRFS